MYVQWVSHDTHTHTHTHTDTQTHTDTHTHPPHGPHPSIFDHTHYLHITILILHHILY